ncbi:hypothetical protein IHE45_05G092600 [Dioscorea alata]|uniref:Uncharacterized protein n=1 Tax=Dioscorea alata TaxID=55571 RepID=A0ACB7W3L2_DIOAL|nr:hypothetical protein IHE45_05G092600 [Dioscorea alata]
MKLWLLALLLFFSFFPLQSAHQPPFFFPQKFKLTQGVEEIRNGEMGSRPPRCHYKCGSCSPCVAIQVPTTNGHLNPEYANYEPEGWMCKCGSAFFNP